MAAGSASRSNDALESEMKTFYVDANRPPRVPDAPRQR